MTIDTPLAGEFLSAHSLIACQYRSFTILTAL
jgi:hypothetical protein